MFALNSINSDIQITNVMTNTFIHSRQHIAQLKSIEQKIDQHQLQDAALLLNQLSSSASRDPRLYLLGSRLAQASNNLIGMIQAARQAHHLAPQWPVATIYLAGVVAESKDFEESLPLAQLAVHQATSQGTIDLELLNKAAYIAQRLGNHTLTLQWLRMAEQLSPNDVAIQYKIGLTQINLGDFEAAIDVLSAQIALAPDNVVLLSARLQAYLYAKQNELAAVDSDALLALEPNNQTFQFFQAVARGLTPDAQPPAMITGLFNGSAAGFDHHQVVQMHYKLPRDVALMIKGWHPDQKADVLDLGCGTGLLGACLGPQEGVVVGVDLSEDMIKQAMRHQVYDRFHHVNILDALQSTPENLYHVIAALDVFVYIGKLDAAIANAHRILLPGGHFVFSCEGNTSGAADYTLQASYRYAHQPNYVRQQLLQAGFVNIDLEDRILRYEAGVPIQGFLVTAQKQGLSAEKTAQKSPKSAKKVRPAQ